MRYGFIFAVFLIGWFFPAWADFHGTLEADCETCHRLPLFENSIHAKLGFSCINCHDPQKPENPKLLQEKQIKTTCYICHDDKQKTFEKMPHGKNGVQCSNCHLPHGSNYDHLLRKDAQGEHFCRACHDKWPHHFIANKITRQMQKLKCTNCHQPHSAKKYYLKYKKEDLCVHCHKEVY